MDATSTVRRGGIPAPPDPEVALMIQKSAMNIMICIRFIDLAG
jgi:hypothetical protein